MAFTEKIYHKLHRKYNFESCTTFIALLEESFNRVEINANDRNLRNISLLSYIQNIRHFITSACQSILYLQPREEIIELVEPNMEQLPGDSLIQTLKDSLNIYQ